MSFDSLAAWSAWICHPTTDVSPAGASGWYRHPPPRRPAAGGGRRVPPPAVGPRGRLDVVGRGLAGPEQERLAPGHPVRLADGQGGDRVGVHGPGPGELARVPAADRDALDQE